MGTADDRCTHIACLFVRIWDLVLRHNLVLIQTAQFLAERAQKKPCRGNLWVVLQASARRKLRKW